LSLKHALLVLLESQPATGYDLRKRFAEHMGYFWSASHQQIYLQLKKLNAEGQVSCEITEQADKPDKKTYTLTEQGQASLQEWLCEPVKPCAYNDALLVKLYAGHLTDTEVLITEISRLREHNEKKLAIFQGLERDYQSLAPSPRQQMKLPFLTLRRGILEVQAWLSWSEEVLAALRD